MQQIPFYISTIFIVITAVTIFLFYRAFHRSKAFLWLMLGWIVIQSVLSLNGFYTITDGVPPRFMLTLLPPVFLFVLMFLFMRTRISFDKIDNRYLTALHIIRIPVEVMLFVLFTYKVIPEIMTFEGRNLDVLSGITALIITILVFTNKWKNRKFMIAWNIVCLALLINIVVIAILSAPFPFQRFGFDQPNIAVLYFPFVLLPACVVPLVFISHILSLRILLFKTNRESRENNFAGTCLAAKAG